jgi:hydroxyacylglutathione hydrolase
LPTRPEYFLRDAEINREGAAPLSELDTGKAFTPAELQRAMKEGVVALDVRPADQFAAGHVPGSINIALSGQFATWAGTVLGLNTELVVIADTPAQVEEGRMRLARVGIEDVRGWLEGGIASWSGAGLPIDQQAQITVQELAERERVGTVRVLDVRRQGEWDAGHIASANLWPLDKFATELPEIDRKQPVAVHCKSGYRSMIACSLLRKAGYKNVINVLGGFDAWQKANQPAESEAPAATR